MAKYRKKPVEIEAFQWTGTRIITDTPDWFRGALRKNRVAFFDGGFQVMGIKTLEGMAFATKGDYIIRDIAGEAYVCPQDAFERVYEKV